MSDFVTSLIRTWTPQIVGAVIGWLVARGITVDQDAIIGLTAFLTTVFSGIYYLLVRLVERSYPQVGVLLGSTKKPEYTSIKK